MRPCRERLRYPDRSRYQCRPDGLWASSEVDQ